MLSASPVFQGSTDRRRARSVELLELVRPGGADGVGVGDHRAEALVGDVDDFAYSGGRLVVIGSLHAQPALGDELAAVGDADQVQWSGVIVLCPLGGVIR